MNTAPYLISKEEKDFQIAIKSPVSKNYFKSTVRGRLVVFSGYEEYIFFIHIDQLDENKFVVSNTILGAKNGEGDTEKSALFNTYKNLCSVSKEEFQELLRKTEIIYNSNQ